MKYGCNALTKILIGKHKAKKGSPYSFVELDKAYDRCPKIQYGGYWRGQRSNNEFPITKVQGSQIWDFFFIINFFWL